MIAPFYNYQFRLILIGDSMVGKSSLVRFFSEGKFNDLCDPTVGVDFFSRIIDLPDKMRIKLQLWDTAGQEKFRSITKSYYRNSVAAVLVFDITKRHTFDHLIEWYQEAKLQMKCNYPSFIIVGHKIDMESERQISVREARHFANDTLGGCSYIETSAITGQNVELTFTILANQVVMKIKEDKFQDLIDQGGWDGIKLGTPHNTDLIKLIDSERKFCC